MIKNFLYSLFLHFLLLMVIYANFNLKKPEFDKSDEVSISITSVEGSKDSGKIKKSSKKKSAKKLKKKRKARKKPKKKPKKSKPKKSVNQLKTDSNKKFKAKKELKKDPEKNESEEKQKQDLVTKDSDEVKEDLSDKETKKDKNPTNPKNSNIDSLDLSAREKFNIQSQLKRCYRRSIDETKLKSQIKLSITVEIDEDGYIDSQLDYLTSSKDYNNPKDPSQKIAIDNIRRALELCSPLRNLPKDKYDAWKVVTLEFDENE